MRRVHLRGHENIRKRMLIHAAGFNLGLLMRARFGYGTPRSLQGLKPQLHSPAWLACQQLSAIFSLIVAVFFDFTAFTSSDHRATPAIHPRPPFAPSARFATGC